MAVFSRPYQSEDDYAALRRYFLNLPDMRLAAGTVTAGDLDWWRFHHDDPDHMRKVQLWLDGDEVVGWIWPARNAAEIFVHPSYRAIEPELIDWAVQRSRENGDAEITVTANDRDRWRRQALADRGFARTDVHHIFRGRSLGWGIPAPILPNGFRFGDSAGADDAFIEARVEVHRAAWEPSRMTVAKHRAVMQSPTYRSELDLVVIGPGEAFATCTIIWFDEQNRIGVFEPVGCHPQYRRRGLTKAMMFEGMRRLQALGAERAFVASAHDNAASNHLYESCGFQFIERVRNWTKALG
jgi:GNAT superfamily N-acetyltransferase